MNNDSAAKPSMYGAGSSSRHGYSGQKAYFGLRMLVVLLTGCMIFAFMMPSASAQSYQVQYTIYNPTVNTAAPLASVILDPSIPVLEHTTTSMQYSLDSTDGSNGVWNDAADGETPFTPTQGWLMLRLSNDPSTVFQLAYIRINGSGVSDTVQPGITVSTGTSTLPNGNGLYTAQSSAPGQLTVTLRKDQIVQQLASSSDRIVPIVIPPGYTTVDCLLNGDVLQALYDGQGGIRVESPLGDYELPVSDMNRATLLTLPGSPSSLQHITLHIGIAPVSEDTATAVQQAEQQAGIETVGTPVQFSLTGTGSSASPVAIDPAMLFAATGTGSDVNATPSSNSVPVKGRQLTLHAPNSNVQITTAIRWNPVQKRIIPVPTVVSEPSNPTSDSAATGHTNNVVPSANTGSANASATNMPGADPAGGTGSALIHGAVPDGIYALVQSSKMFPDVASSWSQNDVNDMASRLIVNGEDGDFVPDREVTRAEFAAMLVRALGLADEQSSHLPKDVHRSDWYAGVVGTAINHGLIEGYNDGNFRPNQYITREEAAMIMSHAMDYTGQSTSLSDSQVEQQLSTFSDRKEVSNWAKKAVAATANSAIVQGNQGHFEPQSHVTRAQAASMIRRLLQKAGWINAG